MNANSIALTPVKSSKLHAIGHDAASQTLAIQFFAKGAPGNVYHYQNFTAQEFTAFASAESVGKHFIAHIQPHKDKHPYTNMGVPAAAPVAAPKLSKELLAVALHGREYPFDLTKEEQAQAKAAGLLVIFGASDDLMELRGIECDEIGAPGVALIDAMGLLPNRDSIDDDAMLKDFFAREPLARKVEALWAAEDDNSWTYRTDVPHAHFDIMEDGIVYCRGIVIDVADMAVAP